MVPLFELEEGETGEIAEISETQHRCGKGFWGRKCCQDHVRFSELGLRAGKSITLLSKHRWGPLMIKIDDTRFAIGRGMADKIKIKTPDEVF